MTINFESLLERPTYGAYEYLSLLRRLLPRGPIWGFAQRLELELLQDTYIPGDDLQDIILEPEETDFIQDVIHDEEGVSPSLFGRFLSVVAEELARVEDRAFRLLQESTAGVSVELLEDWEREAGTLGAGQVQTHAKLYNESETVSVQYLTDYAAILGWTIIIDEGGVSTEPFITGVAITGRNRLGGYRVANVLTITVTEGTGDLADLQSIFKKLKPSHIVIVWKDER